MAEMIPDFTVEMLVCTVQDKQGRNYGICCRGTQVEIRYETAIGPWAVCRQVPQASFDLLIQKYVEYRACQKTQELSLEQQSLSSQQP
jgi:hypothetical protein